MKINKDWLNIVSTCSEVVSMQFLRVWKKFRNALERLWNVLLKGSEKVLQKFSTVLTLYFRFSYLYFILAGNIIIYT